jgi:hypothetical protein
LHVLLCSDVRRLAELQQVLASGAAAAACGGGSLQQQLARSFPASVMLLQLQQFATAAWEALGPSTLLVRLALCNAAVSMHGRGIVHVQEDYKLFHCWGCFGLCC